MTLRSLSHNPSLCDGGEVGARWLWMRWDFQRDFGLNILLVPSPAQTEGADAEPDVPQVATHIKEWAGGEQVARGHLRTG